MQLHLRVRSNTQDTCEPPAGAGRRKDVRLWRNLLWLLAPYNEVHLTLPYSCKLQLGNKHLWHQLQLVLVEWSVGRNSRLTKKWGFFSKEILRNSSFHWLSRSIFTYCLSFVPHRSHLHSPQYDVSDHSNHIFSNCPLFCRVHVSNVYNLAQVCHFIVVFPTGSLNWAISGITVHVL